MNGIPINMYWNYYFMLAVIMECNDSCPENISRQLVRG
jgi:hypothetical protein